MVDIASKKTGLWVHDMGACTPLGFCARGSAAAVWAGVSRIACPSVPIKGASAAVYQAACPVFDADTPLKERLVTLACIALRPMLEALADFPGPLTLFVALPPMTPAQGAPHAIAASLHQALSAFRRGPQQSLSVKALVGGAGAFAESLEAARRYLQTPTASALCLVGGVDSNVAPCQIEAMQQRDALYNPRTGEGQIAGEAGAFLCVSAQHTSPPWPVMARISAWAQARTQARDASPDAQSAALCQSIKGVFTPSATAAPGLWVSDDTGEAWRAHAIAAVHTAPAMPQLKDAELVHPARLLGEVGAAFGPLACIVAAHGLRAGLVTSESQALLTVQDAHAATAWRMGAPSVHASALHCDSPRRTHLTQETQ